MARFFVITDFTRKRKLPGRMADNTNDPNAMAIRLNPKMVAAADC